MVIGSATPPTHWASSWFLIAVPFHDAKHGKGLGYVTLILRFSEL